MSQIVLNLLSRPPIYGTSEWQNTLLRQSNFPIDKSSTWTSYDLAVEYAATDLTAYAGQIISVNENDTVLIYKLVPDTTNNVNFVLEEIASGSSISSLGNWSIETRVDGLVSDFNYDMYLNFPYSSTVTLSTIDDNGSITELASGLRLGETFSTAPVIFSQGDLQLSILSSDGSSTYATYLLEETSNIDGLRSGIFIEQ